MKQLIPLLLICCSSSSHAWRQKARSIKSGEQVIFFPALASRLNGKAFSQSPDRLWQVLVTPVDGLKSIN